jgi:hypothetical protein
MNYEQTDHHYDNAYQKYQTAIHMSLLEPAEGPYDQV